MLEAEGISKNRLNLERYLDMRYEGQSFEIIVPFTDTYIQDFHRLHEKTYGYRNQDKIVEMVNVRLRARGVPEKPDLLKVEKKTEQPVRDALLGKRSVVFDHESIETRIFDRNKLLNGNRITGPSVVVEYSSTIVIPPFAHASVDEYGNLVLEITA